MLTAIKNQIFRSPEKRPRTVTATATATAPVRDASGAWIDLAPGQTAEVLESDAINSANLTYTRPADPDAPQPRNLGPEPREPKPLPDGWGQLPPCFTRCHELNERLAVAIDHVVSIREALRRHFPAACPDDVANIVYTQIGCEPGATFGRVGDGAGMIAGKGHSASWTSSRTIDLGPIARKEFELLDRAERQAWEHARDLRDRTQEPLASAWMECARHRMKLHGERCKLARELQEIGRAIFATRIQALGLHESEVNRLFRGSADFVRYWRELPQQGTTVFLDQGRDRVVMEALPALATHSRNDAAEIEALEADLKSAKADLTRATRAAA